MPKQNEPLNRLAGSFCLSALILLLSSTHAAG